MFKTLTLKDPCKNCIVRACCTEECDDYIKMKNAIWPNKTLMERKMTAGIGLFGIFTLGLTWLFLIIQTLFFN